MASSVTLNVYGGFKGFNPHFRKHEFNGLATIAAGTYTTNGIPFTWSLLDYSGNIFTAARASVPDKGNFYTISGSTNVYLWDQINNTLRIIVAGVELAAGAAIPAGVTGDSIEFDAVFRKLDQ